MLSEAKHLNEIFLGFLRRTHLIILSSLIHDRYGSTGMFPQTQHYTTLSHRNSAIMKHITTLLLFILMLILQACSYSFSGASVPPHIKTVSIPMFVDRSGSGEFNLGDRLTRQLIQKFIEDNTLSVSNRNDANAIVEGIISSVNDAPSSISGGDRTQVSQRKITITVQVTYKDLVKKQTVFQKSFSNYGEYSTTQNVITARKEAIDLALTRISEDILLGVVSNW